METFNIITGLLGLAGTVFGIPTIVLFFLQRRNANRKLDLEATSVDVDVFAAQRQFYKDMLEERRADIINMNDRYRKLEERLEEVRTEGQAVMDDYRDKLDRVRHLFLRYTRRVGVPMTKAEQEEFESTKPRPLLRR